MSQHRLNSCMILQIHPKQTDEFNLPKLHKNLLEGMKLENTLDDAQVIHNFYFPCYI